jgi:hypothetical protein
MRVTVLVGLDVERIGELELRPAVLVITDQLHPYLAGRSRGQRDGSHIHGATSTLEASFQSTLVKRPASIEGARNVFFASSIAASNTV